MTHVAVVADTQHNILGIFTEMKLAEDSITFSYLKKGEPRVVYRSFERTCIVGPTGKQYIISRIPVLQEVAHL